jgi:hypothetical protein
VERLLDAAGQCRPHQLALARIFPVIGAVTVPLWVVKPMRRQLPGWRSRTSW